MVRFGCTRFVRNAEFLFALGSAYNEFGYYEHLCIKKKVLSARVNYAAAKSAL